MHTTRLIGFWARPQVLWEGFQRAMLGLSGLQVLLVSGHTTINIKAQQEINIPLSFKINRR